MEICDKIESHPFDPFLPEKPSVLILGTFPGRVHTQHALPADAWYYGSPRNQFWKIISQAYGMSLSTKESKQAWCMENGIAISDLFLRITRTAASNGDEHLEVIAYNDTLISQVLNDFPEITVLCTSNYASRVFKKLFPDFQRITCLPSPSPRYARISLMQKVAAYKELLTATFN